MMANIIDGRKISDSIKQNMKKEVETLNKNGITVSLAVVFVGEDPASKIYFNSKKKNLRSSRYSIN